MTFMAAGAARARQATELEEEEEEAAHEKGEGLIRRKRPSVPSFPTPFLFPFPASSRPPKRRRKKLPRSRAAAAAASLLQSAAAASGLRSSFLFFFSTSLVAEWSGGGGPSPLFSRPRLRCCRSCCSPWSWYLTHFGRWEGGTPSPHWALTGSFKPPTLLLPGPNLLSPSLPVLCWGKEEPAFSPEGELPTLSWVRRRQLKAKDVKSN